MFCSGCCCFFLSSGWPMQNPVRIHIIRNKIWITYLHKWFHPIIVYRRQLDFNSEMSNILRRSKSWRFPFNEWKWVLFDETTKQLLCRNFNTPFVPVWHVESLTKLLNLQIPNKCAVNWFDCRIASDFNWNRLLFNQSIFKFSNKRTTSQLIKKSNTYTSIFILKKWVCFQWIYVLIHELKDSFMAHEHFFRNLSIQHLQFYNW